MRHQEVWWQQRQQQQQPMQLPQKLLQRLLMLTSCNSLQSCRQKMSASDKSWLACSQSRHLLQLPQYQQQRQQQLQQLQ
jgi:predicted transcriptional regulator